MKTSRFKVDAGLFTYFRLQRHLCRHNFVHRSRPFVRTRRSFASHGFNCLRELIAAPKQDVDAQAVYERYLKSELAESSYHYVRRVRESLFRCRKQGLAIRIRLSAAKSGTRDYFEHMAALCCYQFRCVEGAYAVAPIGVPPNPGTGVQSVAVVSSGVVSVKYWSRNAQSI